MFHSSTYVLPSLPPPGVDFETKPILKALVEAKAALLHLKGQANAIPNQGILINTLAMQEAQASSAIENIVTTQDDLYRADIFPEAATGPAKEVARYNQALRRGYERMRESQNHNANRTLIEMYRILKNRSDGFRSQAGTALKNDRTGEVIYIPPQHPDEVAAHMAALETFVNGDAASEIDPLVKMAIIHHQFESIHPFFDGNGRIGRILNVLYLSRMGLLDAPILYLSRYINQTKADYYRLLQDVREHGAWEEWVVYMLKAVADTSRKTLTLVEGLRPLMADYKKRLRTDLPKIYSQDLLNNLFRHPYTRIDYVMRDLDVSRPTASKYLERLTEAGLVEKHLSGRDNYYINKPLVALFAQVSPEKPEP